MDWYKRDPIAFLDGVQGMGPEMIGAYAVILDLLYARGGEMPRDDRHLSGVLGCSIRKATALTDALIERGKVVVRGGFITNSRVETDAKRARNLSETRAKAGRSGGEASGAARKNNDLSEANASSKRSLEKRREEDSGFSLRSEPATAEPPPDPVKVMFDAGVALLAQAGVSAAQARSLIGKLRSEHGTEAVIAAIGAARREGAVDPAAYLQGALRHRSRDAPQRKTVNGRDYEFLNGRWTEVA